MKMETEITAPNAGVVTAVHVAVGDSGTGCGAISRNRISLAHTHRCDGILAISCQDPGSILVVFW